MAANWTTPQVKSWVLAKVSKSTRDAWAELLDEKEIDGGKLLALSLDDLRSWEQDFYSIYEDVDGLHAAICSELLGSVSADAAQRSAAALTDAIEKATLAASAQIVMSPNGLTEAAESDVEGALGSAGVASGTFLVIGEPTRCLFTLFVRHGAAVHRCWLQRSAPGQTFAISEPTLGEDGEPAPDFRPVPNCEHHRTLQGLLLGLQSDWPEDQKNPLPGPLGRAWSA